jgi:hypothetical protein
VGDGYNDAAAEADALEVAAADELVSRGATDAEDLGGLLDGEGEWLLGGHAPVGLLEDRDCADNRQSVSSTTLGGEREIAREATGCPSGNL